MKIEPAEHKAWLDGSALDLSPLLFRLLQALAECPGRLVTRVELKRALWPYATRIDTERRLNTAMRALRERLGDDAEAPRFIATERGYGYRWVAAEQTSIATLRPGLIAAVASMAVLAAPPAWPEHGGLSDPVALIRAQAAIDSWRAEPSAARLQLASAAIAAAGRNNPASAAYWVLSGQLALEGRWDWATAEKAYRHALRMDPSNADARLALAWLIANRGDRVHAAAMAEALVADSVISGERRAELGWLLIRTGRPDLAAAACPIGKGQSINALSCAHTALAATGDTERAREAAVALMRLVGADAAAIAEVASLPRTQAYARFLDWRADHFLPVEAPAFQRAQVLADAGRGSAALETLAESVAKREPLAVKIHSTPSFEGLRTNPRYRVLAKRVGAAA